MPRMNYNIMEIIAVCHASHFAISSDLDITIPGATQGYMYDRVRLRHKNIQDKYVYGEYFGTDGQWHLGFDVGETNGHSTQKMFQIPVKKSKKKWFGPVRRRRSSALKRVDQQHKYGEVEDETELNDMDGP